MHSVGPWIKPTTFYRQSLVVTVLYATLQWLQPLLPSQHSHLKGSPCCCLWSAACVWKIPSYFYLRQFFPIQWERSNRFSFCPVTVPVNQSMVQGCWISATCSSIHTVMHIANVFPPDCCALCNSTSSPLIMHLSYSPCYAKSSLKSSCLPGEVPLTCLPHTCVFSLEGYTSAVSI